MAKDYKLEADISSRWIGIPVYRLWVDGELICERSFWPNPDKHLIRETVIVSLETGDHMLKLEQVDASLGKSWVKQLLITDLESETSALVAPADSSGLWQEVPFSV